MSTISASTLITTALQYTADTTGTLVFKTGATPTTALTLNADQSATFAGTVNFATAGFTNLSYTGTLTGGTGVIAIGTNQIYKDASGNVGIGTSSPVVKLQVTTSGVAALPPTSGTTPSTGELIRIRTSSDSAGGIGTIGLSTNQMWLQACDATNLGAYYDTLINPNGGNVGIGTSSPYSVANYTGLTLNGTNGSTLSLFTNGTRSFTAYSTTGSVVMGSVPSIPLVFTTADTERMRIDTAGNVGIGTSSPTTTLFVNRASAGHAATFYSNGGGVTTGFNLYGITLTGNVSSGSAECNIVYGTGGAGLAFNSWNGTTQTERMRIDSSGNVGIGVSNPAYRLVVQDASSATRIHAVNTNNAAGGSGVFLEVYNGGTQQSSVTIRADNADNLAFFNKGGERMRITSGGALCVGTTTTTPLGSQTGASNVSTFNQSGITLTQYGVIAGFYYDRLNFNNAQYFVVNSSGTGVYIGNGATSWTAYSDSRLKNVTGKFDTALADIAKLEAIKFTWKSDDTNKPCVGLIAQSVEKVLPEAVDKSKLPEGTDKTEYLAVRYTEVIPLLVAAIQELKAEFDEYKATHP